MLPNKGNDRYTSTHQPQMRVMRSTGVVIRFPRQIVENVWIEIIAFLEPRHALCKPFEGVRGRLAHHTPLATSPKVTKPACIQQAIPSSIPPRYAHRAWIRTPKACTKSDKKRQMMKTLQQC